MQLLTVRAIALICKPRPRPLGFDADSRAKLGRDQTKSGKIKGNQGLNSGFTTGTPAPEVNLPECFLVFFVWY